MITGNSSFETISISPSPTFPEGGGEMGSMIRNKDWSASPVGSPAAWPQSLRNAISTILASRLPMMIFWGAEAVQFYNDAFRTILDGSGKHPKALGQQARDCWSEVWFAVKPPVYSALLRGEMIWQEDRPLPFGGQGSEEILWTYSYNPINDETGKTAGVLLICSETIDRLLIQQKATESERNFRTLVEESPVATAIISMPDMKLELANEVMLNTWRKDRSVLGKKVLEFLPELKEQGFETLFNHVHQTGKTYEEKGGVVQMNVNGILKTAYMDYTFKALRDKDARVTGILITGLDVTDQILASLQLEHSERTFRNMILQAPVAISIFRGPTYIVEVANHRMLELWDRSAEQVIGKPAAEGLNSLFSPESEQRMDTVFYKGERLTGKEHPLTIIRDGKQETIYLNFEYDPIRELDGTISGIITMATDVTDQVLTRKKIETEVARQTADLRLANYQLKRSSNALEHFASLVSRDLKMPIQRIHAHSEILKKRYRWDLGQEGSQMIDRIQGDADRVKVFFEDLLSYSSIPSEANTQLTVNPGPIVSALLKDMDRVIQEKEALVAIGNLYPMKGDSMQLMLLFKNLLDNALKFSRLDTLPDITMSARIVSGKESGCNVHPEHSDHSFQLIEVSDNGIGFDQQHAEKIFGLFQRLHGPDQYPGNGMGLSIVKKIVDSHNGYITVKSKPGKGAAFKVLLPYEAEWAN